MKRLTLILMLVAIAAPAFAEKYFLPISATEGILITSNGPVQFEKVSIPSIGIVVPIPKDPTVPNPNPTDLQSFASSQVKSAVQSYDNRSRDALRLSYAYSAIVDLIDKGTITTSSKADEALRTAVDSTLSFSLAGKKWDGWRASMAVKLNSLGLVNLAGVRQAYSEISAGLSSEQMEAYLATEAGAAHEGVVTPEDVLSSEAWGDGAFLKFFLEVILPILLKLLLGGI